LVNQTDIIFTLIFTIEAALKIIAMSFIIDEGSYLRDYWNWLDFVVVITSIVSIIGTSGGVSALRSFRLFRPLRSLHIIPSMKKLIETLLDSFGGLCNIFVFLFFFIVIFAILSINLWSGNQH